MSPGVVGGRAGRAGCSIALFGFALLALASTADAAFPGANGKIVFFGAGISTINPDGSGETPLGSGMEPAWSPDGAKIAFVKTNFNHDDLYTMNADGSNVTPVSTSDAGTQAVYPAWSPDGTRIVFSRGFPLDPPGTGETTDLYKVNADGTGLTRLTDDGAIGEVGPSWSPDGKKIAFHLNQGGDHEIYTMNPDGTGLTQLTTARGTFPDWSPDGTKIVFESDRNAINQGLDEIYVMNADGTNETRLTNNDAAETRPAFSPDGTRITFDSDRVEPGLPDIYVMNADGTSQTKISTNHGPEDFDPNWQPIPINSYPRPKGATPFKTFLVVAYKPCAASNRTHGAPLAFGSCAPPQQASEFLTVGTGDANGKDANSIASVRYDAFSCPACAGPGPNADVRIAVSITDVRRKSDLSDYSGELRLDQALRITDKSNTPNPGGPGPGTVSDTSFPTMVPCAATSDTTVGSTCSVMTSANTLVPNAVVAGERAIWQIGQVQVYDGGVDGVASTTGDNTLFMDEGVFIP